jgi:[acyl-carrier-protein] S-malonyltransferase
MAIPSTTGTEHTAIERIAFVFPGQGSQAVGMGRDLFAADPIIRALFREADDTIGFPLSRIILEGPEDQLQLTENTQPALLVIGVAIFRALGLQPVAVAGHSLGEYSAVVAAGGLEFRDAVHLVHRRGLYMQEAVPPGRGAMLALIGADEKKIDTAVAAAEGNVDIANYNAPGQVVIAGETDAVRRVAECVGARQTIQLAVSAPFHCRLMRPAELQLASDIDATKFFDLQIPLYNNVDARRVKTAPEVRDGLKRQVTRPVRWTESIQRMIADGIDTFVELGPGSVLSGLIRRIDRTVHRFNIRDCESLSAVRRSVGG